MTRLSPPMLPFIHKTHMYITFSLVESTPAYQSSYSPRFVPASRCRVDSSQEKTQSSPCQEEPVYVHVQSTPFQFMFHESQAPVTTHTTFPSLTLPWIFSDQSQMTAEMLARVAPPFTTRIIHSIIRSTCLSTEIISSYEAYKFCCSRRRKSISYFVL